MEQLSTNLETELLNYKLLMSADVVSGKVIELELYVMGKTKREVLEEYARFIESLA